MILRPEDENERAYYKVVLMQMCIFAAAIVWVTLLFLQPIAFAVITSIVGVLLLIHVGCKVFLKPANKGEKNG